MSSSFPFPRSPHCDIEVFFLFLVSSLRYRGLFPFLVSLLRYRGPFPFLVSSLRYRGLFYHTNLPLLCSRTNLAATLANAQINPTSKYGKVFPHMCDDGRYPSDFNTPKTVETMKVLDSKSFFLKKSHSHSTHAPFRIKNDSIPLQFSPSHPSLTVTKPLRLSTRPHHAILPAPSRPPRRPTGIFIRPHQPLRQQ